MQTKEFHEPTHLALSVDAYYRWQANGSPEGRSDEHWFAAETELMQHQAVDEGTRWTRTNGDLLSA